MTFGILFEQRDIVFIPLRYTDLSIIKHRPVLVISNRAFHNTNRDLIICPITTNDQRNGIPITQKDMERGIIAQDSVIKTNCVQTLEKTLISRNFGKISKDKTKKVIEQLNLNFTIDS